MADERVEPSGSSTLPDAGPSVPSGGGSGHRLALGLLLFALVPLIVLGVVVDRQHRQHELHNAEARLTELAEGREAWLETHLAGLAETVAQLAQHRHLLEDVRRAVVAGDSSVLPALAQHLEDARSAGSMMLGAQILDPQGAVVASVGHEHDLVLDSAHLARAREAPPLILLDSAAVAPGLVELVLRPLVEEGRELGFVKLVHRGDELLRISSSNSGLGETGEVLTGLRDANGVFRFIGPTRFGREGPFARVGREERLPVHEAVRGVEAYFDQLVDYRGEAVLAATRHIDGPGWGLVVKMDRSEALSSVVTTRRTFFVGAGLITVLVVLLAFGIAGEIRRGEEALVSGRQEVAEARDELAAMLAATPMPLFGLDPEGRVQRWNKAAEAVFGWSADEVRGELPPTVPEGDLDRFHALRKRILAGGTLDGVELERRRKDGSTMPIRAYGAPIRSVSGKVRGIVGIMEDIRLEKGREHELEVLNRALRFVSASNMAVVRTLDREELLEEVCAVALDIGGYAHIWIALDAEDGRTSLHQLGRGGASVDLTDEEVLLDEISRASDVGLAFVSQGLGRGGEGWEGRLAELGYRSLAALPLGPDSQPSGFVALAHGEAGAFDAAELEVLRELVTDLSYGLEVADIRRDLFLIGEAVESLSTGVCVVDASDPELPIVFVNEGLLELTGYTREEVLGRPWDFCIAPDADEDELARVGRAMAEREGARTTISGVRKSGGSFWDRLTVHPVRNAQGDLTHWVVVHDDVTEERALNDELAHRSRLAAVGELAGGVAHDFRNILSACQGLGHLTLGVDGLPEESRQYVEELQVVLERGRNVTERLLAFSRRKTTERTVVDFATLLSSVTGVVGHTLRDDIHFTLDVPDDLDCRLKVDSDEFTQTMLNLVRNAEQAMPRGGRLTVTGRTLTEEGGIEGWPPDFELTGDLPWLWIALEDTGEGMDQETVDRAFDPYFTTKPAGEGTGLGLPAVYGAVDLMGGRVWLRSEPGVGTTVHLVLPTTAEPVTEVHRDPEEGQSEPCGTVAGTILFAEDDESVLRVYARALEKAGHTVVKAADGAEAMKLFQSRSADFDVIVTDGVMPRASGADLARAVWDRRPGMPVIVTSGFGSDDLREDFPSEPRAPLVFLPKPFDVTELLELVRELAGADGRVGSAT